MTPLDEDRNGKLQERGADPSEGRHPEGRHPEASHPEAAEKDGDPVPFGSLEVQDRIRAISEIYRSLFYSIDSWIEDGEEIIEIEHFFLTGDMEQHIQELAHPFAVEFVFEDREGNTSGDEDGAGDG